jgi:hypothetical protein
MKKEKTVMPSENVNAPLIVVLMNFSRSCTRPSLDWFIEERV